MSYSQCPGAVVSALGNFTSWRSPWFLQNLFVLSRMQTGEQRATLWTGLGL
jgi:hypothetical protein